MIFFGGGGADSIFILRLGNLFSGLVTFITFLGNFEKFPSAKDTASVALINYCNN